MKPLLLEIRGMGPHADTIINFAALSSPVAILAPLGTGKTTLLEAITHCLWGRGPWYPDTYDLMTQGGTGEAEISLRFAHGGAEYSACRTLRVTAKTKTQTAVLFRVCGGVVAAPPDGIERIAGPKLGDFNRAIESLIGDYDTFVATQFLGQNRAGDLVGQPGEPNVRQRRRDVFYALIGADGLDALEGRVGVRQREVKAVVDELAAQLAGQPDPTEEAEGYRIKIAERKVELARTKQALADADAQLEVARAALRDVEAGESELRARIERHETAERAAKQADDRLSELQDREREVRAKAEAVGECESAVARMDQARQDRERLEAAAAAYDVRREWEVRRDQITASLGATEREIAALESQPGADPQTLALAGQVEALREEYSRQKAENDEIKERNAERERDRSCLSAGIKHNEETIRNYQQRAANRPETPFGDQCAPCPLMQEWADLPKLIEAQAEMAAERRYALSTIADDEIPHDLTGLIERGQAARSAAEAVAASKAALERLDVLRREREVIADRLAEHNTRMPPEGEKPSEELKAVQAIIDGLTNARDRLADARAARDELPGVSKRLQDALVDSRQCNVEADESRAPADAARKLLDERETELSNRRGAAAECRTTRDARAAEAAELATMLTRTLTLLEAAETRAIEQRDKRNRLHRMSDDLEGLADLRQCFGPHGVRQLLIDQAAPELESIAAELFERATEGRQHLRISTLRVGADGSMIEDFQILVTDERGERDALRYSGGQLQMIIILFRLAVALWVGRLKGHRPECLILDEAFDRLGPEGTEDLLRVLEHLAAEIELIVVVTHDPLVAARMASSVRLTRLLSGVEVEIAGAAAAV